MLPKLIRKEELSSSAGFKSLKLRSSQSYRPQSGLIQASDSFIIPFEMSEQAFASSVKADLMTIEQEIQSASKLSFVNVKQFSHPHLSKIKQWLSAIKPKETNVEPHKIVQLCQCSDSSEALVKLYHMICTLDLMVTKLTELQSLHLLQYDSYFEDLQSNFVQKIAQQGVLPNRFLLSLINLERIEHLVQKLSKAKSNQQSQESQDLYDIIESQKNQIKQLKIDYAKLQVENRKLLEQQFESSTDLSSSQQPTNYYCRLIDDVKESFQNVIQMLREENQNLSLKLMEVTQKWDQHKAEHQDIQKKLDQAKHIKEDLYQRLSAKYKTVKEYEESYEAALREEYQAMQHSYDQKVQKLNQQMEAQNKEFQKKYSEMKQTIDQLSDKERLLTKKLSAYMKV